MRLRLVGILAILLSFLLSFYLLPGVAAAAAPWTGMSTAHARAVSLGALLLLGLIASGSRLLPGDRAARVRRVEHGGHSVGVWPCWQRSFVLGVSLVWATALALAVFALGSLPTAEVGWRLLAIALAGGLLGEWMKYGLLGRHLTLVQFAQDAAITGVLAASASTLTILQAPANWSELLLLSSPVAAVTLLGYHLANLHRLTTTQHHLRLPSALVIVGIPYILGSLGPAGVARSRGVARSGPERRTLGGLAWRG